MFVDGLGDLTLDLAARGVIGDLSVSQRRRSRYATMPRFWATAVRLNDLAIDRELPAELV